MNPPAHRVQRPPHPLARIVIGAFLLVPVFVVSFTAEPGRMTRAGAFCIASAENVSETDTGAVAAADRGLCVEAFDSLPADVQDELLDSLSEDQ